MPLAVVVVSRGHFDDREARGSREEPTQVERSVEISNLVVGHAEPFEFAARGAYVDHLRAKHAPEKGDIRHSFQPLADHAGNARRSVQNTKETGVRAKRGWPARECLTAIEDLARSRAVDVA